MIFSYIGVTPTPNTIPYLYSVYSVQVLRSRSVNTLDKTQQILGALRVFVYFSSIISNLEAKFANNNII